MPPPPAVDVDDADDTGIHSMLMAWYMSGYHTGYYQVIVTSICSVMIGWSEFKHSINKSYIFV